MRHCLAVLVAMYRLSLIFLITSLQSPDAQASQDSVPYVTPTDAKLSALIDQLGSRGFRDRQRATQALKAAGAKAIPILHKRVSSGRLELAARAMSIFERAYIGRDPAGVAAADVVLEALAESKRQAVSEMAKTVLERNEEVRTRLAIANLTKLNAEYWDGSARSAAQDEEPVGQQVPAFIRRGQFEPETTPRLILDRQWTGGVEGLKYVRRLTNTRIVVYLVKGLPVPEAAKLELDAAFPNGNVTRRGPVMLGVKASPVGPVIVSDVEDYSSAWKVLKQFDRLLAMDGEEVLDFDHLIGMLKTRKVGDQVEFDVQWTNDEGKLRTEKRTVTLKDWRLPRATPQNKKQPVAKPKTGEGAPTSRNERDGK